MAEGVTTCPHLPQERADDFVDWGSMVQFDIRPLDGSAEHVAALADMLVEAVAAGGSLSFMHPLDPSVARDFWAGALEEAARGLRLVLGAWDGPTLAGTVTLLLNCPPNQPHRGEIAKMMTRMNARGRGVATALMRAAEAAAFEHGRTLITLDTATIGGASAMYEKLGFTLAGIIPDYALLPHGGLTGTMLYWKRIGPAGKRT